MNIQFFLFRHSREDGNPSPVSEVINTITLQPIEPVMDPRLRGDVDDDDEFCEANLYEAK